MIHTDGKPTIAMKESDVIMESFMGLEDNVWPELLDIYDDFKLRNNDFNVWEKEENLSGLVTGLKDPEILEKAMVLLHDGYWLSLPEREQVELLTTLFVGIRMGNELAKRRNPDGCR